MIWRTIVGYMIEAEVLNIFGGREPRQMFNETNVRRKVWAQV